MRERFTRRFWLWLSALVSLVTLCFTLSTEEQFRPKTAAESHHAEPQGKMEPAAPVNHPDLRPTEPARFVPAKQMNKRKRPRRPPAVHAAFAPVPSFPKTESPIPVTEPPKEIQLESPNGASVVLRRAAEARPVSDKELKLMAIEAILDEEL